MAYGLSKVSFSAAERLAIGERDDWLASVSEEGVFLEPNARKGLLSGSPKPSETLHTHLRALASQEYCSQSGETFFFTHEEHRALSQDDQTVLQRFCGWLPCSIELHHRQSFGHPEFSLEVRFMLGSTQIYPQMAGAFARHEGRWYQMTEEMLSLFDEVEDFNRLTPEEKKDLPKVLASWGTISEAAQASDADLDRYLAGELVVTPKEVKIDIREEESGTVSIVLQML